VPAELDARIEAYFSVKPGRDAGSSGEEWSVGEGAPENVATPRPADLTESLLDRATAIGASVDEGSTERGKGPGGYEEQLVKPLWFARESEPDRTCLVGENESEVTTGSELTEPETLRGPGLEERTLQASKEREARGIVGRVAKLGNLLSGRLSHLESAVARGRP
jgi:hypothetical protein